MSTTTRDLPRHLPEKRRFWSAHVQRQQQGSLTQRAYCERHGLGYASFSRWRALLRREEQAAASPASALEFVPVEVATSLPKKASARPSAAASSDTATLTLVFPDGMRLEGISEATLPVAVQLASAL